MIIPKQSGKRVGSPDVAERSGFPREGTPAGRRKTMGRRRLLTTAALLGALALLTGGWLALWLRTRGPQPLRWE